MARLIWVDSLKGLAIFLVVLGHNTSFKSTPYDAINTEIINWIYSFHIPLFYMVSGFFLKPYENTNCFKFIINKAKRLLIPYLIYGIVLSIVLPVRDCLINFNLSNYLILTVENIKGLFYGNGNNWPVWFLSALFASHVFLYITINMFKISRIVLIICLLIMFFFILLLNKFYGKIILPCEIDLIPITSLFMLLGNFIFTMVKNRISKYGNLIILTIAMILIIIGTFAAINNARVDINSRGYGNFALFIISSITISTALILAVSTIKKSFVLSLIGEASLMILGIHILIGILLNLIIQSFFQNSSFSTFGVYMYILTTAIIQTFACLPLYILIKKLNLKFLI
jgi:fucose 4-O-acetylase-like acetyltransferase